MIDTIGDFWKGNYYIIAVLMLIGSVQLNDIYVPPTDSHAWRQTQTLGVSRNYIEFDYNFFKPSNIVCDSRTGIMAQEFPIMNYMITIAWKWFGEEVYVWRLLLLLVNLIGLFCFYLFIKGELGEITSLFATMALGCSIFLTYGTKAMPDVFSISLVSASLVFMQGYLKNPKIGWLIGGFVLLTLGILAKMPATVISTLILIPILRNFEFNNKKLAVSIAYLIAAFIMYYWYFVWCPHIVEKYGFNILYPATFSQGWSEVANNMNIVWEKIAYKPFYSYYYSALLIIGLLIVILKKKTHVGLALLAGFLLFSLFAVKTGILFVKHEYYWIPIVPVLAVLIGVALQPIYKCSNVIGVSIILCLGVNSIGNQWWDFQLAPEDHKYLRLESIVDQHVPKESRILTNDEMISPRMMYFAHRRGWNDQRYEDIEWIKGEYTVGMEYLVLRKDRLTIRHPFPVLFEDYDFIIYKVEI